MSNISSQRVQRARRPRNVFSPSDNNNRPTHYLLYFDSTDSYNIVLSSSINNISDTTATVYIRGKKTTATIVTSGTFETCEREQVKRTRESQHASTDDQNEESGDDDIDNDDDNGDDGDDDDLIPRVSQERLTNTFHRVNRTQTKSTTHHDRLSANDESPRLIIYDNNNNEEMIHQPNRTSREVTHASINYNTATTQKKRKSDQTINGKENGKRRRKNALNRDNDRHHERIDPTILDERNTQDILNQVENHLVSFRDKITRSIHKMEKKFDAHIGSNLSQGSRTLDQYRTDKREVFPTENIYNGQNLLSIPAKDLIDFSRKLIKLLYSTEELRTHILPPPHDHLKRPALDQKRFDIFLEVIRIKFQLDADLFRHCYNDLIKAKLSSFLYEERRRETRRRIRNKERALQMSDTQQNVYDSQQNLMENEEEEANR